VIENVRSAIRAGIDVVVALTVNLLITSLPTGEGIPVNDPLLRNCMPVGSVPAIIL
jgi:hypothetical protein